MTIYLLKYKILAGFFTGLLLFFGQLKVKPQ